MLCLLFMAILCCRIPFSNGKSSFKMGFNLLNNKSCLQHFLTRWSLWVMMLAISCTTLILVLNYKLLRAWWVMYKFSKTELLKFIFSHKRKYFDTMRRIKRNCHFRIVKSNPVKRWADSCTRRSYTKSRHFNWRQFWPVSQRKIVYLSFPQGMILNYGKLLILGYIKLFQSISRTCK